MGVEMKSAQKVPEVCPLSLLRQLFSGLGPTASLKLPQRVHRVIEVPAGESLEFPNYQACGHSCLTFLMNVVTPGPLPLPGSSCSGNLASVSGMILACMT